LTPWPTSSFTFRPTFEGERLTNPELISAIVIPISLALVGLFCAGLMYLRDTRREKRWVRHSHDELCIHMTINISEPSYHVPNLTEAHARCIRREGRYNDGNSP
jgi:hypothetical protein